MRSRCSYNANVWACNPSHELINVRDMVKFPDLLRHHPSPQCTGTVQILDISANTMNPHAPGYTLYAQGMFARIVFFRHVAHPSGAGNHVVTLALSSMTPAQVSVEHLAESDVSVRQNARWASQVRRSAPRFPASYYTDVRHAPHERWELAGMDQIVTMPCDQTVQAC
ncbi:hypothetical protein B0H21DRAFT_526335 [Amylocystis lapponica]|nr:hypothetical protein B0H21DRAFT_526335 [Amylocystis lapponica]